MSTFLTGKELNKSIYEIIWNAERTLLIVSPYIKLDDYFKKLFENHKHNYKLHILIIFGKNESEPGKSLRKEDIDFFKQFRKITIVYCADLHAKYYANESKGVITSINLYDKSFERNIEYGVYFESPLISLNKSAEVYAFEYSQQVANSSPVLFVKRPVFQKSLLGSILGQKNYIESDTLYDKTDLLYNGWYLWKNESKKFLNEFPEEINAGERNMPMPEREVKNVEAKNGKTELGGYCIRTGIKIPYNVSKPMCYEAYQSWAKFQNWDYPEKYCHATGKLSNGRTTMKNPILK